MISGAMIGCSTCCCGCVIANAVNDTGSEIRKANHEYGIMKQVEKIAKALERQEERALSQGPSSKAWLSRVVVPRLVGLDGLVNPDSMGKAGTEQE